MEQKHPTPPKQPSVRHIKDDPDPDGFNNKFVLFLFPMFLFFCSIMIILARPTGKQELVKTFVVVQVGDCVLKDMKYDCDIWVKDDRGNIGIAESLTNNTPMLGNILTWTCRSGKNGLQCDDYLIEK